MPLSLQCSINNWCIEDIFASRLRKSNAFYKIIRHKVLEHLYENNRENPDWKVCVLNLRVTARHVEVTPEVREYLEEKIERLPRFYDHLHSVEVILDHESEQFRAEIIVHADRKQTFVARGTGPDTFVLIDQLIDKLERQLTKHKEKNRNHKFGGEYTDPATEA